MKLRATLALFLLLSASASANTLAALNGAWSGGGWARETPDRAQEALRYRLKNTYEANVLTASGRCVESGRKISLSGELKSEVGSDKISGHWSNPDGLGAVQIIGVQRDGILAFLVRAKDPETGREIAQYVEWRIDGASAHLRAFDRANPSLIMSDICFTR